MESRKESKYKVIITEPAEQSFYEILNFLYDHYPWERAEQLADELRNMAKSLGYQPERGTIEKRLEHRKEEYRYILFRRTSRADTKIIYFVKPHEERVCR